LSVDIFYIYMVKYSSVSIVVSYTYNFGGKEEFIMKEYITPELKALAFIAQEAISTDDDNGELTGSHLYNDDKFGEW